MKVARRGFFSMLGSQAAATAAALNIPEPEKAESMKRGGIYALKFDTLLTVKATNAIYETLKPFTERTGCEFLVLDRQASITELGSIDPVKIEVRSVPAALPTIVDVVDCRLGNARRVILDGIDVTDQCCYRAELFSDGRGIAYFYKQAPTPSFRGDVLLDASGEQAIREQRTGKMEFGERLPQPDYYTLYGEKYDIHLKEVSTTHLMSNGWEEFVPSAITLTPKA
jgi:hypothetical protein